MSQPGKSAQSEDEQVAFMVTELEKVKKEAVQRPELEQDVLVSRTLHLQFRKLHATQLLHDKTQFFLRWCKTGQFQTMRKVIFLNLIRLRLFGFVPSDPMVIKY